MNAAENDKMNGWTAGRGTVCAFGGQETPEVGDLHREAADGAAGTTEDGQGILRDADAHRGAFGGLNAPEAAETQGDAANGGSGTAKDAENEAERTWRTVYEPVERAIVEEHERRVANRVRRQEERAEEKKRMRGDLLETTEGFSAVWEREMWTYEKIMAWANGRPLILTCLAGVVRKEATRLIDRLRHAERRPMYYAAENARRRALAEERRRVRRRTTTNPCPTREQILDGWLHRSDSHEATIRFGSLIMDLECHVDNSLVFDDDGAIVGRRGGVKRWLQENIPALYLRYTTVMRYKAAAQKLRQIAELRDPVPAAAIVDPPCENRESDRVRLRNGRNPVAGVSEDSGDAESMGLRCGRIVCDVKADISQISSEGKGSARLSCGRNRIVHETDTDEGVTMGMEDVVMGDAGLRCGRDSVAHARAIWREVVEGISSTSTALMARIDALTDPRRTAEDGGMLAEWKRKYAAEITMRTKSGHGKRAGWMRPTDSGTRQRIA